MTAEQLAAVQKSYERHVESDRRDVGDKLRQIIEAAQRQLALVDGGHKLYRSTHLATLGAELAEALCRAEIRQDSLNELAWLSGNG